MFVVLYPGLGGAQRDAARQPEERDPVGDHLQRADHPGAGAARAQGRDATARIGAGPLLARNLAIYGAGGLVAPFVGIKLIDLAVTGLQLA